MADDRLTQADFDDDVPYEQSSLKRAAKCTYPGDDSDYHVLEVNMSVNGGLTYGATNETDKTLSITLYGAFESGVDPAGEAAFPIDIVGFDVLTASSDYTTTTDKFPFYLIRCKLAAGPDGEDVTIKACSWEQ